MTWQVLTGDCIEVMAEMAEASVDAIVTDPPYGLEFMGKEWDRLEDIGKTSHAGPVAGSGPFGGVAFSGSSNVKCQRCGRWKWDHEGRKCECGSAAIWPNVAAHQGRLQQEWHHAWATEALRVLKPGAHLLAFGGTRTYHRLACALEDAGFEIRDCLAWLYGSGFPKSLNLNGEHKGWGTALKPAFEPIVLARKPLAGTVAANVQEHGTGALNIDGTRIGTELHDESRNGEASAETRYTERGASNFAATPGPRGGSVSGRWPANVLLDEDAAAMLDEQSGELTSGALDRSRITAPNRTYGQRPKTLSGTYEPDSGGASRFFYVAKADREERNRGLEHYPKLRVGERTDHDGRHWDIPESHSGPRANHHPTVKPVELMQWLCRLVTPPKGLVLDPFLGSGSTAIAALREGFDVVGIEREPEYVAIARDRIIGDAPLFNVGSEAVAAQKGAGE